MYRSILLLSTVLLLQSKCTRQNILDQYTVNKSQDSHDVDYSLSGIKLSEFVTVKPSHSPEDRYSVGDYANVDSIKSIPGKPGLDYPVLDKVPETSFSCETRSEGYYADPETGCQVFHICLSQSVKTSFLCPNGSIFSQDLFTCDWWNRVHCQIPENINQNKNYGQTLTRNKVLATPVKPNNIVENISFGEAKNKNNVIISELNDMKGSVLITSRAKTVTQLAINTKFPVTTPVVAIKQSKPNNVQSETSNLVLPAQYKCCNNSKVTTLSEPLLLNLDQTRSSAAPVTQHNQFFQTVPDLSTLSDRVYSTQMQHSVLTQNSEPTVTPSQQKNDSSLFPVLVPFTANQRDVTTTNSRFQTNVQSLVSSTTPVYTATSRAPQTIEDSLEYTESTQGSLHVNKTFVSGQVTEFDSSYSLPTKYLPHTTSNTFELHPNTIHSTDSSTLQQRYSTVSTLGLPERIHVNLSEYLQSTIPSNILQQYQHTTPSNLLEQPQYMTPNTILEEPQYSSSSILKQPQHSTSSTKIEQPQHTTSSTKIEQPQRTTSSTKIEQPQHTTSSTKIEQPQHTTSSTKIEQPQHTTSSTKIEQPQHTTSSTKIEQPQHTTSSTKIEQPQHTASNTVIKQPQHTTTSNPEVKRTITLGKLEFPLHTTTVSNLQLPQQFASNGNLHNQSNNENSYYYVNSADSYSSQTISDMSVVTHIPFDVSKSVNECTLTKNCSHIDSPSSDSEDVKESTSWFNNAEGKSLFILDTLINPFKKEYFHESELHSFEYKNNKKENGRINTHDVMDVYRNENTYSPPVNMVSTPVPFTYTELLQQPPTQFVHQTGNSRLTVIDRQQNTQTLNLKASDILNLNNLNLVNEQHHLSERTGNYRPTIVKSISFNFDTEEGRKEFDVAVSSGLLTEV